MTVSWQKIEMPMGFGIDTSAHEFVSQPPGLSGLLNGRWDKDGQVNVREGYTNVAQPPGTAEKLLKFKERVLVAYADPSALTNNVSIALAALNNAEGRFDKQGGDFTPSALTECTIEGRSIVARDTLADLFGHDIAIYETGKLAVISWCAYRKNTGGLSTPRIYATVLDIETLATVTPIQEISTGDAADAFLHGTRIVIEGTTAHVLYAVLSGAGVNRLRSKDYNLSTRAWGNDTILVSDIKETPTAIFDAYECNSTSWFLAYRSTTPSLKIVKFSGVTSGSSVTVVEDATAIGMMVNATDALVWVCWYRSGVDLRAGVWGSAALAPTLAAMTVEVGIVQAGAIGIARVSSTKALICWSLAADLLTTRQVTKFRTLTTGGSLGTICSRYSIGLASRPVQQGAHFYAICGYRSQTLPSGEGVISIGALYTVALVGVSDVDAPDDHTAFRACAIWAQGTSGLAYGVLTANGAILPQLIKPDATGTRYWFTGSTVASVENTSVDSQSSMPRITYDFGVDLCRMDLGADDRLRYAQFGEHLFIAGGMNLVFDGDHIVEHGFHYPPEDALATTPPGGALSAGSYQVALVWEYRLNSGAIMRSQPAIVYDAGTGAATLTAAGGDKITVSLPPLNLTQKWNPFVTTNADNKYFQAVAVVAYRTESNGSILYRDTALAINDVFGEGNAEHLSFDLTASDTAIKIREQLYTTGGAEQPHWTLPAADDLVVYKNRLFTIPSEDKHALHFTSVLNEAELPWWHPFFVQRIDDEGDNIGLAVMDDNLVVFKEDSIWIVRGNGPDNKGLNSDYIVSRVQSPHGCIERRSIVSDPTGVYFQSRLGLMRLTRSMEVQFVGEKIPDAFDPEVNTIVQGIALPNYTERIYWLLQGDDSPGIHVYQWSNDQWAFDQMNSSEDGFLQPQSMVWVNGIAYALFGGETFMASHEGNDDFDRVIDLAIVSHWFKFDGQQGFKRIRAIELLGEQHESHNLAVLLFRDYLHTPFQVVTFASATLDTLDPYQVKIHVSEQRMESLRMLITVDPNALDSNDSRCVTFAGMAFDVGIKGNLKRVPDIAQAG